MVEPLLLHEGLQVGKVGIAFAGIAHNQGGADGGIGQLVANALQHRFVHVGLPGAVHGPQHLGMAVLQGQVQVGEHVGHLPEGGQHRRCETRGVGVVDANPGDAHGAEGTQQFGQHGLTVEVLAVVGGDLADEDQLLHPFCRQLLRLRHDGGNGA